MAIRTVVVAAAAAIAAAQSLSLLKRQLLSFLPGRQRAREPLLHGHGCTEKGRHIRMNVIDTRWKTCRHRCTENIDICMDENVDRGWKTLRAFSLEIPRKPWSLLFWQSVLRRIRLRREFSFRTLRFAKLWFAISRPYRHTSFDGEFLN